MNVEAALSSIDTLLRKRTGARLSELQRVILYQVWQGQKYWEIANAYGCTEGHAKDEGSQLWKKLSHALRQKVTKSNCRAILERYLSGKGTYQGREIIEPIEPIYNSLDPALPQDLQGYPPASTDGLTAPEAPSLIGRVGAIADLNRLIHQGSKVIVLQGEGGVGKTTLAQHYLHHQGFDCVLELVMAKETPNLIPVERVVEEWLKQDFQEEPGIEFGVTLGRLKRQLQTRRVGVLIDNLEPALDQQGRLIPAQRNYIELLRLLADARVQAVTLITSRDRLCEPDVTVEHYRLFGLEAGAWTQFFSDQMAIDPPTLQQMHHAYGGNTKAMGILSGVIQADFEGDMVAYWQENSVDLLATTDLRNLTVSQINRLQTLDPPAYRLLCRLSCYRYQEIPTIPKLGLSALLWDVPPEQHRRVIAALRNRSLIECHKTEYWLHPVIRAEAIARLRASPDWETANQQAAEFWTHSVAQITTVKEALQALEAYYHYIEIQAYGLAGKVILKSRHNQWRQHLPLGSTLYRMGLLQPVLTAITEVLNHVEGDQTLSELYNILGDLYWITGKIHQAIACQQTTITLVTQALQADPVPAATKHTVYYLRMLEVDSLLSIGLYQIDLGELASAAQVFQQVIDRARNTDHHRWAEKATVCLALVNSELGCKTAAATLAENAYTAIATGMLEQTGRFAYFMQILGHTYLNLSQFDQATDLFHRVLTIAETSHYTQVNAKALNGLAAIHRHRSEFESALAHHRTAIEQLETIGAQCDLAQAYFQLGLTYHHMGQLQASQTAGDRAIQLFNDMSAPQQIAKVVAALGRSPVGHSTPTIAL
jgi:tetratricopeptide (TPR) repeat protein